MSSLVGERPAPSEARPFRFPLYEWHRLPNGLDCVVCPIPGRPLAAARLVLDAGSENESPSEGGVAELAARALTEGTQEHEGAAFDEAAERLGADIEGEVTWDGFQVRLSVPVSRLEQGLALLAEAALRPAFPEREVDRLRGERLNELLQEFADPGRRAHHAFLPAIYTPDSAYARPYAGAADTVAGLGRGHVESFYRRYVTPRAGILVVAGDIDPVRVREMAERLFADWGAPEPAREPPKVAEAIEETSVTLVHRPGSVQSHIMLGHLGIPRVIPDYPAVQTMSTILGGLFGSRLNLKLREEKGYTYGARARFDTRRRPGPFFVSAAVESSVTVPAILDAVGEVEKLKQSGAEPAELDEARDYLVGVFPLAFETPDAIASAIAHLRVYGLPADYYDTYRPQMQAVTLDDVAAAAATRLRPERVAIVAVGDGDRLEGELSGMGMGPVRRVEDMSQH